MQLKRKRNNKARQTIAKLFELFSEETPQQIIIDSMEAETKESTDSFQVQDIDSSSQNQSDISKQEKSD
ncbi:hypothetical protein [Streptococcus sp. A22]|uniref:hypothetical protein n=1 Tax=Streptococcus sp. A22 TaxID=3373126 RepID=UPI00374CCCE4